MHALPSVSPQLIKLQAYAGLFAVRITVCFTSADQATGKSLQECLLHSLLSVSHQLIKLQVNVCRAVFVARVTFCFTSAELIKLQVKVCRTVCCTRYRLFED